jgi:hypothetical protein
MELEGNMITEQEKIEYLAYKLLEWSGVCQDRTEFRKLLPSQVSNAMAEAKAILNRIS